MGLSGFVAPEENVLDILDLETEIPAEQSKLLLALLHATVAAGYAIEQTGMPSVSEADGDSWNGESYLERFGVYLVREGEHIANQLSPDNAEC